MHAQVTFGHACDRNINGTGNAYKQHFLMEKTCIPFSQASENVDYMIIRDCEKRRYSELKGKIYNVMPFSIDCTYIQSKNNANLTCIGKCYIICGFNSGITTFDNHIDYKSNISG